MRFNLKKALIASLCLCFVIGSVALDYTPVSMSASALSDAEYKELISNLEKDQAQIEADLKDLKNDKSAQNAKKQTILSKVDNLQTQINICNTQLNSYNDQIEQLEEEIETKNKELEDARYAFKQRLRAIYMSGGTTASSLTVLMSADNFCDLFAITELMKSVSAYVMSLINKLFVYFKLN